MANNAPTTILHFSDFSDAKHDASGHVNIHGSHIHNTDEQAYRVKGFQFLHFMLFWGGSLLLLSAVLVQDPKKCEPLLQYFRPSCDFLESYHVQQNDLTNWHVSLLSVFLKEKAGPTMMPDVLILFLPWPSFHMFHFVSRLLNSTGYDHLPRRTVGNPPGHGDPRTWRADLHS